MSNVRIKDIAKEAGVSIGTVDRVLHNRGEVKKTTREKVLRIVEKLDYKPNIAARVLKTSTSYKIAIMIPLSQGDSQYWSKHQIGFDASLKSVYPFTVETRFFQYGIDNNTDFNRNATLIVNWKPDGVIMAPILRKESQILCSQLDSLNIPYAFIDSYIENTNVISFVGEDAYQGGRVAASIIDLGIDNDADMLIVNITRNIKNVEHISNRHDGFMSYFLDSGNNKGNKINVEIPSEDINGIKDMLDPIFEANPNIKGVVATSSRTYAVARYLNENNKKHLFLVGYEVFGKNIKYMEQGVIDYLIGQRPIEQAEKVFKNLFDHMAFNNIPNKKDYQPVFIYNIENIGVL